MKRVLLVTAALVAAVAIFSLISLPPEPLVLDTAWRDGSVAGAIHVHTDRSDGSSSPEEVAAAAARAGLSFVVFTDHGDGTRAPDPPVYRAGVLCLDGVEVSTTGGHYIAIDLPQAPYRLGGEPRDVVDDVRRLGGFGIAAHPDSPKPELQWRGWGAPFDAIEMINPDSGWRAHASGRGWRPKLRLGQAFATYPFRKAETIAGLLQDSPEIVRRWTALSPDRRVVGIAGVDAHARLELRDGDPGDNRFTLPIPGYDASFRVLSARVYVDQPLTGEPAADAQRILRSLRGGRMYVAIDGWATPPAFELMARNGAGAAQAGDELAVDGPVLLRVRSNAPARFTTTLWKGDEAVASGGGGADLEWTGPPVSAVYRAEIRSDDRPDGPPWIISNPIYLRDGVSARPSAAPAKVSSSRPLFDGRTTSGWTTEADATSMAVIEVAPRIAGSELRLRYALSGGTDIGQFAGVVVATTEDVESYDRVSFTIRAEHPMRVSVQARAAVDSGEPQRWQRSLYVDPEDVERTVLFSDMSPVGMSGPATVPAAAIRNLLFVIDTVNTKPGASGRVWLRDVRLER